MYYLGAKKNNIFLRFISFFFCNSHYTEALDGFRGHFGEVKNRLNRSKLRFLAFFEKNVKKIL